MPELLDGLVFIGGNLDSNPHEKVLLYLNKNGKIILNKNAPKSLKDAFILVNN